MYVLWKSTLAFATLYFFSGINKKRSMNVKYGNWNISNIWIFFHQSLVDLDIHKTQILMGFPSLVVVHTVMHFSSNCMNCCCQNIFAQHFFRTWTLFHKGTGKPQALPYWMCENHWFIFECLQPSDANPGRGPVIPRGPCPMVGYRGRELNIQNPEGYDGGLSTGMVCGST